ncbi:MAG: glycosyltransferase family 2 protein [Methylococcaceae bacterium]|nr:glycosyltransferase family 2 protein [Methylococcaceae bacterium]
MMPPPEISVIIPAYNEGESLDRAIPIIREILDTCVKDWEMLIIDDGSRDDTYPRVCHFATEDARIKGVSFSRNFGKEAALLAGMKHAKGRAAITIDADLQHPPAMIPELIAQWRRGAKIVHAVKRSRKKDSLGKRFSAYLANKIISRMGGINIRNSSDYKLLDREIVDILAYCLPERERFFRGLSSWIGFEEEYIYFDVSDRIGSESKWSFWGLMELSITAITSFTSLPLRIITFLGIVTLGLGFGVASDALWSWYQGEAVSGFATLIITLLLIGSFIMISLGIIGEYIAKIYEEIKARPPYLVKSTVGLDDSRPNP